MPFWPFYMIACAGLTIVGWRKRAWRVPALALLGFVLMRANIGLLPPAAHEIAGCALWLCIAAAMMYARAWVPGFLLSLSALAYPAFLVFGVRIEYLGLSPIVADVFAILAILAIGGGILGLASHPDPPRHRGGLLGRLALASVGMAAR